MLYLIGRALDLEDSLRGLAAATADGPYAKAMLDRIAAAKGHLEEIAKASGLPEVQNMLAAVNAADLKPGNADALNKMAAQISAISSGRQKARMAPSSLRLIRSFPAPTNTWEHPTSREPDPDRPAGAFWLCPKIRKALSGRNAGTFHSKANYRTPSPRP